MPLASGPAVVPGGRSQGPAHVVEPRGPVLQHGRARELVILRIPLVGLATVDQLHDRHDVVVTDASQKLDIGVAEPFGRQLGQEAARGGLGGLRISRLIVGVEPGPAGEADVLLALGRVDQGPGHRSARGEQVDLEDHEVAPALLVEDVLQRRVRDEAAVPVGLALDLDRREARRQGAGGHDVLRADPVAPGVEVGEVAGADVDGADAEAGRPRVDAGRNPRSVRGSRAAGSVS